MSPELNTPSIKPYDRVLYVCAQGVIRSRTAEILTVLGGVQARSCGIDADALVPATNTLATWATVIVCMEQAHQEFISQFMGSEGTLMRCLDLPDIFDPFEPKLMRALTVRLSDLPELAATIRAGQRRYLEATRREVAA